MPAGMDGGSAGPGDPMPGKMGAGAQPGSGPMNHGHGANGMKMAPGGTPPQDVQTSPGGGGEDVPMGRKTGGGQG